MTSVNAKVMINDHHDSLCIPDTRNNQQERAQVGNYMPRLPPQMEPKDCEDVGEGGGIARDCR